MIPKTFEYYKVDSEKEAFDIYSILSSENKKVYYYAGGSEIITMSRASSINVDAVIDLKGIKSMQKLKMDGENLIIGSMATLSRIGESRLFPLLGTTVMRIADHTNQNRITIGGNVCGTIIYREAILPLLLADASCSVYINGTEKEIPINSIFNQRINLSNSEFITKFKVGSEFLNVPYFHLKKTKSEKIDYPLITLCALKYNGMIRIAFSGLLNYPFRSLEIEEILNDENLSDEEKADSVIERLPKRPANTITGSGEFKLFLLKNMILEALQKFKECV